MPSDNDWSGLVTANQMVNITVGPNQDDPQIGDYIQIIPGGGFGGLASAYNPPLVAKIIQVAPTSGIHPIGGPGFNYPIGDPNTPCRSYNCKKSKFGNQCIDPGDGSGQYNMMATCQGHCSEERADNPNGDDDRDIEVQRLKTLANIS
jgi:hypothetical protein